MNDHIRALKETFYEVIDFLHFWIVAPFYSIMRRFFIVLAVTVTLAIATTAVLAVLHYTDIVPVQTAVKAFTGL